MNLHYVALWTCATDALYFHYMNIALIRAQGHYIDEHCTKSCILLRYYGHCAIYNSIILNVIPYSNDWGEIENYDLYYVIFLIVLVSTLKIL